MAATPFPQAQLATSSFVESAGAVAFHPSTHEVVLVLLKTKNEWLLAKGRVNTSERRKDAVIREVLEETGYRCRLLPVTAETRRPPAVEEGTLRDLARVEHGSTDPVMLTTRTTKERTLKLIAWFVAAIEEDEEKCQGEKMFEAELCGVEEAMRKLTYAGDKEVLEKAVEAVKRAYCRE